VRFASVIAEMERLREGVTREEIAATVAILKPGEMSV
jgi:hypothetical protein